VDRDDPRIQSPYKWMTPQLHARPQPGHRREHGCSNFYNAFAKVMAAYGEETFVTARTDAQLAQRARAEAGQPAGAGRLVGQPGLEQVVEKQPPLVTA